MEASRSIGTVIGRLVGTFALLGAVLGLVGLALFWQAGLFDAPEAGTLDLGAALMGGMISLVLGLFVALGGILVAVVAGLYSARAFPFSRRGAVLSGLGGSGLGHVAMGVSFALVLALGTAALAPEPADAGAEGQGATPGFGDLMESMLLAVLPAALVGAGTAAILHEAPRGATVVAVRGGSAGGRPAAEGEGAASERPAPPRMVHEQTAGPGR